MVLEQQREATADIDRDSLHILPLSIIPFMTPALKRARMIKNVHLDSIVELFEGKQTGSGQIDVEAIPREFGWLDTQPHPDHTVLRKLALLPSFDVFSLRVLLRDHGIAVNDHTALRLSESKNKELTHYMADFTRPLIKQIYGSENMSIDSFDDIVALFKDPDVKNALQKLKIMAARLEISVEDVPKFLEDYGDIFLSLSYYRQALDHIEPIVSNFLDAITDIRRHYQLRHDVHLMKTCRLLQETVNAVMANVTGRFESFDRATSDLWSNVSAERFRRVQKLISSHHIVTGGVLCALSVKMDAWARLFPTRDSGGPGRRAEFLVTEMRQGIEKIQRIEDAAPMLSALE
ncbi:MAG: hypothetical protein IPM60_11250 [Rhodospirillales bacterium]|nr:hypothetical protein [Rhodospirillales bacterium]